MIRPTWHTTLDTRYGYQWQRCNTTGVACADIAGARNLSYRLQTADARARLRVVTVATNVDGSTTVATAPTAAIKPALPGIQITPRLTVQGRADVGKTLTLTPATWSASTEIDTKVLQFWRCNPRCSALSTDGAGAYVLDDADAGAMMRGSETATGPGGSTVAWAATWLGPVRSASTGFASLSARSRAVVRTSRGVALAQASVGPAVVGGGCVVGERRRRAAARSHRARLAAARAPRAGREAARLGLPRDAVGAGDRAVLEGGRAGHAGDAEAGDRQGPAPARRHRARASSVTHGRSAAGPAATEL